ncbi:MAG: DNA-binding response regulator [Bacteroidetes bacterium HGW-Bacteroidetes-11]|jgi:two-component system LytT family response regulator|nr:MAG: DNA-binding response regulator [Bacteroidetes bacterium HGW-Bacteroidetes-11]
MKKYRAIIVDDERNVREALALLLNEFCPEIELCGSAVSAAKGRTLLKTEKVDFIFLDISMPGEDGFTFLKSIPKDEYGIIFVTAYEEYALNALKANAIDYLLKPVDSIELREAVSKAIQYHELRKAKADIRSVYRESLNNLHDQVHSENRNIEKITIAEQFGFRMVKVSDIMYLQADSNYTILHLSGFDKIVATRSMCEFEKILENSVFFRIHKSTIINMNFLKAYSSYEGNFAELTDGTRLSISRRKLIEIREAVKQFSKSIE